MQTSTKPPTPRQALASALPSGVSSLSRSACPENNINPTEDPMSRSSRSHVRRTIEWIKRFWSELDYVQRRLIEIRTGIPQC